MGTFTTYKTKRKQRGFNSFGDFSAGCRVGRVHVLVSLKRIACMVLNIRWSIWFTSTSGHGG